ncbi:MAG TPA: hypothetical protein VHA09_08310 [Nitrososphaera sp.]|nr:hypothetical protein [Nitrososphaera sp.]
MIVATTQSGAPSSAPSASYGMSPVAMASIIVGSAIFVALLVLVAHASYRRKKEYDWHVAEWRRAESDAQAQRKKQLQKKMEQDDKREMLH